MELTVKLEEEKLKFSDAPGSPKDPDCRRPRALSVAAFCAAEEAAEVNELLDAKFLKPLVVSFQAVTVPIVAV
jgi:hypothetical protein